MPQYYALILKTCIGKIPQLIILFFAFLNLTLFKFSYDLVYLKNVGIKCRNIYNIEIYIYIYIYIK